MKYLGMELPVLSQKGAVHTAREISQQPALWQAIWEAVRSNRNDLNRFLGASLPNVKRIILTGAGTSAYIGLSVTGVLQRSTGIVVEPIPSTDLVSHPRDYFHADIPTLMISFARSGNSPESVAAVALAEDLCRTCFHLVLTCNPEGELAKYKTKNEKFVFSLPPEANDQSLAMTSSYTGMLLTAILIARLNDLEGQKQSVDLLAGYGRKLIDYYASDIERLADQDFKRVVFLGSGPFYGTARESYLKMLELTDGRIVGKEDSFLGFRHGPKAIINDTTLVFYIFSNHEYVSRYERDLVESMKKGPSPFLQAGVAESPINGVHLDRMFYLSENGSKLNEEYLAVCSVLPAQLLGFYKSLKLGLRPDTPSTTGAITRVVEGVQIYDLGI
jgi:tagatose-6-phosphate ketose/aldose isomerase